MIGLSQENRNRAVSAAGGAVLTGILATCRYRAQGQENFRRLAEANTPVIFALWHGRLLPCTYHHRNQGIVTLISQHRDGEYIARMVQQWGYTAVRGSSTRGGSPAFRQLLGHLRAGRSLAITPDGPQGPRERMKPGPLLLAQLSGAPIIPATSGADRGWWFGGWDRFLVPQPFARIRIAYGEPLRVPRDADAAQIAELQTELELRLAALMQIVDGNQR